MHDCVNNHFGTDVYYGDQCFRLNCSTRINVQMMLQNILWVYCSQSGGVRGAADVCKNTCMVTDLYSMYVLTNVVIAKLKQQRISS